MPTIKARRCKVIVFPLLLAGMLLSLLSYGCESKPAKLSNVEPPPSEGVTGPTGDEVEPVAEAVAKGVAEDAIAQRLAIAGIKNPQAAKAFIAQMNTAATNDDRQAIAELLHYPFTTYEAGNPIKTYRAPAELLADFEQVVTPTVLTAMAQATYDDLFANYKGAMIGNGEVWFGQFDEGIKILAINSQ
jgi:hypothetical protein